jgi:hypothetical protein
MKSRNARCTSAKNRLNGTKMYAEAPRLTRGRDMSNYWCNFFFFFKKEYSFWLDCLAQPQIKQTRENRAQYADANMNTVLVL